MCVNDCQANNASDVTALAECLQDCAHMIANGCGLGSISIDGGIANCALACVHDNANDPMGLLDCLHGCQ
jgi:hypothetical protein